MAKVKSLQSSEESKAKKAAKDLRYKFAKTDKQKKFLDENPNVKTASEIDKKIKDMKYSIFRFYFYVLIYYLLYILYPNTTLL
jgi:hypothetical protein